MEVAFWPLTHPNTVKYIQQSHRGGTRSTLRWIQPFVPGYPICMVPARYQPRKLLNCTHPPLEIHLAWPWTAPTQEIPGQCLSTPNHSVTEGPAHCPSGNPLDYVSLTLAILPAWTWLATTQETASPCPGSPNTRTCPNHAHSASN